MKHLASSLRIETYCPERPEIQRFYDTQTQTIIENRAAQETANVIMLILPDRVTRK